VGSEMCIRDRGNVLCDAGRSQEAIGEYKRAIEINPRYFPAYNNAGTALRDQGRVHEAIEAYRAALELNPRIPEVYNNLGVALTQLGRSPEALAAYRDAIEMRPAYADAHSNLGVALYASGDAAEAVEFCSKAVELAPDSTTAHSNLSLILLGAGEYERGWIEHEWRFKCNPMFISRPFAQPQWKGEALNGRTILLHAEQGLGDTIQFSRFVPMVADRGGRVIVECQGELVRLLEDLPGVTDVLPRGAEIPAFDLHCPFMSLPLAMKTIVETIPAKSYLHARPALEEQWAQRLGKKSNLRIGLVWAGRSTHSNDANRSMRFEQFLPLLGLDGVTFHSLQHGRAAQQMAGHPRIIAHTEELTDFAETAALIAQLDMVISVDTAVAHLAGGMGKPVWIMLPFASEWRWMIARDDSPWYPTARLFRQKTWGDWAGVVERIADALKTLPHSTMPP